MEITSVLKICIIFLIGFLSANILGYFFVSGLEIPFMLGFGNNNSNAPFDFISEDNIELYDDKIVLNIEGVSLSRYAPTGSMKPVLDEGSNGLRIVPKSEIDIHTGDIITFKQDNILIVHRVIEKGIDSKGVYFITKGDNNSVSDGKIRFKDIKYKTIGVIW